MALVRTADTLRDAVLAKIEIAKVAYVAVVVNVETHVGTALIAANIVVARVIVSRLQIGQCGWRSGLVEVSQEISGGRPLL